jgi:trans-aconitate methyltransferase
VLGIDLSENMLAAARATTAQPAVRYERADLETLVLPKGSADLVVSSLALHYIADFARIAEMVAAALVPGGDFVFSVEHPVYSARAVPEWVAAKDGRQAFAIADYSVEGARRTSWIVDGVVKYHRTIATLLNTLVAAGFAFRALDEWRPTEAELDAHPDWRETELTRPMFLLIAARKPANGSN